MRMTLATSALLASGFLFSGCNIGGGSDDSAATPAPTHASASTEPTETTETTPAETTPPTISTPSDLVGDWQDTKAKWEVHFKEDGTVVEDFQGLKNFRTGKYTMKEDTVTIKGGDGYSDTGKIEGTSIKFKLGTLTKKSDQD